MKKSKTFHAADVEKSKRLKNVLRALCDRAEHSTAELFGRTRNARVSSDISECRANGYNIVCRYLGLRNERRVFTYRLLDRVKI
jgi:hypothetical protein